MEVLQRLGSESCPVELRQAVALVLKNQWTLVKYDSWLMRNYWLLTLTLLQDPAESVRNEMAKSISVALSHEMISYPGMSLVRYTVFLLCTIMPQVKSCVVSFLSVLPSFDKMLQ